MFRKIISKPKFLFITVLDFFSSLKIKDEHKIDFLIKALDRQSIGTTMKNNGGYYVNKMDRLCKFMDAESSIAIFRPRRMGKSTMINDLEFLYKNGK